MYEQVLGDAVSWPWSTRTLPESSSFQVARRIIMVFDNPENTFNLLNSTEVRNV